MQKGQWFIVAAVIASGVFLAISVVFKSFAATDASRSAAGSEEFYLWSVRNALSDTLAAAPAGCTNLTEAVGELRATAERSSAAAGYFLFLNVTLDTENDCASRSATTGILVASERALLYENVNPDDVVPGAL